MSAIGWTGSTAMRLERLVIIGAGPAGLATARSYREHGGDGKVTLIGTEPLLPYRRPPLTKEFLRGELEAGELPIEREEWFDEHGVDLRLGRPVSAIDLQSTTVSVDSERVAADAIVLATGSEPVRPKLSGIEHPNVFTIRELRDSETVARRAQAGTRALVIGSGFIGCEIAASLAKRGVRATLVGQDTLPQAERLGHDAAERIAGWLGELGVQLVMNTEVRAITDGRVLELKDGGRLEGDYVILGVGVRPRVALARDAGLHLKDGAIPVDCKMQVRDKLLAVGDIAYAHNVSAGRHLRVEHWGDALEHGEVAGRVLAGEDACWESVPGFWSTIAEHTLKYAAWGDGHDRCALVERPGGGFTVWYSRKRTLVGVLTCDCDHDYERGRDMIKRCEPAP